jgi:hypothetical protein
MSAIFSKLSKLIRDATSPFQYGFIQSHTHLTDEQLETIRSILDCQNVSEKEAVLAEYETKFGALVGEGLATSFASGRMAFFALMKALGIGEGDEVVLTAFTCSVMANAILKTGATPIYADMDRETFGSNAVAIQKVVTARTKLIVAQHSFGIPCDIEPIVQFAKERGIYVVEDCAITLGSSLNGIEVGNWGDAAIFSTDHSKPINTIIGGLLYTKNTEIHRRVMQLARSAPPLPLAQQMRLWGHLMFERKNYIPSRYPRKRFFSYLEKVSLKIKGENQSAFLEDNYGRPASAKGIYPYPAQMPAFLAQLGIYEVERWEQQKLFRKRLLARMIENFSRGQYGQYLPAVYSDKTRDIVPLRLVFSSPRSGEIIQKLAKCIDVSWIWFRQPITCAVEGLESLLYVNQSCPTSEEICAAIVNIPCNVIEGFEDHFLRVVDQALCSDEC